MPRTSMSAVVEFELRDLLRKLKDDQDTHRHCGCSFFDNNLPAYLETLGTLVDMLKEQEEVSA